MKMQLLFEDNSVVLWVIESPSLMRRFIGEMKQQVHGGEGRFVLSDQTKELDIVKNIALITDIFEIDANEKKCWNKALAELKDCAFNEKHYLHTQRLFAEIQEYLFSLELDSQCNICFDEIDFVQLIKAFGGRIEGAEEPVNNIVCYMKSIVALLHTRMIVFVNLADFLEKSELEMVMQQAKYLNLNVLLIESKQIYLESIQNCYIIDKDMCEIY